VQQAREAGLRVSLEAAADRQTALEFAAVALKRELAASLTVGQFLEATRALTDAERERVRRAVPGLSLDQDVGQLRHATRNALAATLRVMARKR
jgi:hypothetical protein